jgi:acyl-CoA thioesterase-1
MSALSDDQLGFLIRFIHPEKIAGFLSPPGEELLAPVFDIDLKTYQRIKQKMADDVKRAAQELLTDTSFAARIDRLPFSRGATVVGLGDSITDDYGSWVEILRQLLAVRRPNDEIRVINAGVSGDTTSQIISRFLDVVNAQPEWIICFAGTNDARRHGLSPQSTLLGIEETGKNFRMLRHFATTQLPNTRWAWMTPATVIEELLPKHWFLGPRQVTFLNRDLAAVAEIVKRQDGPVVDLQRVFGVPANPALLIDDGLHPSLAGQKAIVMALVETLTG